MNRIKLKKVSKKVYQQKGFPSTPFGSCLTCLCGNDKLGGACCDGGVHMDKETFNILFKYRKELEKIIGVKFRDCFFKKWSNDPEFLGGNGILTRVKNGTCIFRSKTKPGCEIVSLVFQKKLPPRAIPSACRLYPITWGNGKLYIDDIRKNCLCINKKNKTKKSIYETQKKELDDIFDLSTAIFDA
jgi:hypothetical protein